MWSVIRIIPASKNSVKACLSASSSEPPWETQLQEKNENSTTPTEE